jgi:alpha-tubulin suppressor-like RCC1 family protein
MLTRNTRRTHCRTHALTLALTHTLMHTGRFVVSSWLTSGRLFTWGSGEAGQLGHGELDDIWNPRHLSVFDKKAVQMVACGSFHVLAMVSPSLSSHSIETYSWGNCICGQLGHGDFQVNKCIILSCNVVRFQVK